MTSTSSNTSTITTTPSHEDSGSIRLDRLRAVIAGETRDGRHGLFFGRLPLELFDHIASYLECQDLVWISAVCCAWRGAVLGHPGLWNCLGWLDIERQESVDLARVVAGRARGALRTILLSGSGMWETELAATTLRQILREISVGDGGRSVREITLVMHPYAGQEDHLESSYSCIVLVTQFAQFAAVNLRTLTIESALPRYPSSPFLIALPSLHHLTVTSETHQLDENTRMPEFLWQVSSMRTTSSSLRTLVISGTRLDHVFLPAFPFLCSIELYQVSLYNVFELLSKCAETLKNLWLRDVEVSWPIFSPSPKPASVLVLSALGDLQICGNSPHLWSPLGVPSSKAWIQFPVLRRMSLADQDRYDPEDYDGQFPAASGLTAETLSTLFHTSPELSILNLRGTDATPPMLCDSLPSATHTLSTLDLSNVATDELVDRLHGLVPSLSHLIVEGAFIDPATEITSPSVSLPALARLASRLVSDAPLDRALVETRLRLVADRSMERDVAKDAALMVKLRYLLLHLGQDDVFRLIASLVSNSPPGGPSFPTLCGEVLALGTPLRPVVTGNHHMEANEGNILERQRAFDAAQAMMHRWLEMKEANAAVLWCAECRGVKLVCGADEDDDGV